MGVLNGTASVSWSAPTYASTYNVKRATASGGPYTTVAANVSATSFSDTGLSLAGTYFYVVSAVSEAGEGANSTEVRAADAYQQWAQQHGLVPGAAGSGFAESSDGSGVPNGVRYGVPGGLNVTPGAGAHTVTFSLRSDPGLQAALWTSTDLINWNVSGVPAAVSNDQSGVPAGFTRMTFQDTASSSVLREFYRLQLSR